jgi:hypothetical protein
MYQPLSLGFLIAVAFAGEAQRSIPATPDQAKNISTAKEQILTFLRHREEYGTLTRAVVESLAADEYLQIDEAGQSATKPKS